jgi:hypothetical protein
MVSSVLTVRKCLCQHVKLLLPQ